MVSEIPFDDVFAALADVLPAKWNRLILYAEYGKGSYMFEYYVDAGDGNFVQCYDLKGVPVAEILDAFEKIDGLLSPLRKEKGTWSNLTLQVSSDLRMKADFDYTDLSEGSYEHRKRWSRQYLQNSVIDNE